MLQLFQQGQYLTFALLIFTIIISLSVHEYAHAASARHFGDRTAEQQGRLTLSPLAHIDPMGLLMIILVGFGWAKPVPTNPRNFNSQWATPLIAAAGPFSNLVLAFLAVNLHAVMISMGLDFAVSPAAQTFFSLFVLINIALMLFNMIPLGPLDGHYILPYLLPRSVAEVYVRLNARYGTWAFLGLIIFSFVGFSVFTPMWKAARWIVSHLQIF
ncbi:MAG: site-2 protease family protein [Granulosicoccus sp.]